MVDKSEIYYGNIFWLLEGMKIINNEFSVNFNKLNSRIESFQFYDCIIFNKEKEHSLYFSLNAVLNEFFTDDRCQLILKLLKIYVYKYSENYNILSERVSSFKSNSNKNKEVYVNDVQKRIISSKVYGNIYIKYDNDDSKWIYNYEIKRLLFNFIFLPDYAKIQMIRVYPLDITEEIMKKESKIYTFVDSNYTFDSNIENKESKLKKGGKLEKIQTKNDKKYTDFAFEVKKIFYNKYGLNLKKMDVEGLEISGVPYIIDVKELKFEKFDTKYIQLKSEKWLRNFQSSYKYHNLDFKKDAPNIKDFQSFFNSMLGVYNNVLDEYKVKDFLVVPPKNTQNDEVIKFLRPKMNVGFSELLEEDITVKEFADNCSNKLYNNY